jgi:hypothetical protein
MSVQAAPAIVRPTRRTLPIGAVAGLVVVAGLTLFVVASATRNAGTTMAGAFVTSLGIGAFPVELAMRSRLGSMHRGVLLLGTVLLVQALHTVEHVVQLMEWYRLDRTGAHSQGIVSQLNVEWVHFGWNWIAWLGVALAWRAGVRSAWMVALAVWITAHSLEHSYMLFHYLQVVHHLDHLGLPRFGASEVLPGVLGRDGWLSRNFGASRPWLGPLTAAPRVAVHFWWNVGELTFLVLVFLTRKTVRRTGRTTVPSVQSEPVLRAYVETSS